MELLLNHAGRWPHALSTTVIRPCVLAALLLFSSISAAVELEELSVTEAEGEYRLRIVSVLDAPAHYVYNVITDYKHAYRINPSVIEAEILPSGRGEVVRARNLSEHWVGPFSFNIEWVGDIAEARLGEIKVTTIPELSSFESGSATWEIRPQGGRTWVLHESCMKPNFFIPPIIGDHIVKSHMKEDTLTTFKRIECHAKTRLEMDMENDPENLKVLLKEMKGCIHTQEYEATIALENQ